MVSTTIGTATFQYEFRGNFFILQVPSQGTEFKASSPNHNKAMAWAIAKAWGISPGQVDVPLFSRRESSHLMVSLMVDQNEYIGEAPMSDEEKFIALINAFCQIRDPFAIN